MFTGIIEEVGVLRQFKNRKLMIACKKILEGTKPGDSISVNGVCLTVEKIIGYGILFHVSQTTGSIAGINGYRTGRKINLERALTLESRLGGHLVSGHVDGTVKIVNIEEIEDDRKMEFMFEKDLKKFLVPKGSVALDGISLTINEVLSSSFTVTVIPETLKSTNFRDKQRGDIVNLEVDMVARYLKNLYESYLKRHPVNI